MHKQESEMVSKLSPWWPSRPAIYDIQKSYLDNAEEGPFFDAPSPSRTWPAPSQWIDFLGYRVASPIGVPAGPLLNAKWISLAGELGFDILCYKTIRSSLHPGHGVPNVIYIKEEEQLNPRKLPDYVTETCTPPQSIEQIAITNSFGMPSRSPEYLRRDIPLANSQLSPAQVMIVSVVGTPAKNGDPNTFKEDFVQAALLAKESGAKIIEANFSCPNVSTGEGCIYYNPESVFEIGSALTKALGDIPLIIKLGLFPELELMRKTFLAAARAGVRAICGINTISMKVLNAEGQPALGLNRLTSGICGNPIREAALNFVREARTINDREKLGFCIMGVGGVTAPQHFREFLNAGADVAMCGTGMMWDPYIALRYHEENTCTQQKTFL